MVLLPSWWWLHFAFPWTCFQNVPLGLSPWISSQKPQKKCNKHSNLHPKNCFSGFNTWTLELSFVLSCWHAQSCLWIRHSSLQAPCFTHPPSKRSLKCFYNWTTPGWNQRLTQDPGNCTLHLPKTVCFSLKTSCELCPGTLGPPSWPSQRHLSHSHCPWQFPLTFTYSCCAGPLLVTIPMTTAHDHHPWVTHDLLPWPSPTTVGCDYRRIHYRTELPSREA